MCFLVFAGAHAAHVGGWQRVPPWGPAAALPQEQLCADDVNRRQGLERELLAGAPALQAAHSHSPHTFLRLAIFTHMPQPIFPIITGTLSRSLSFSPYVSQDFSFLPICHHPILLYITTHFSYISPIFLFQPPMHSKPKPNLEWASPEEYDGNWSKIHIRTMHWRSQ